MGQPVISHSVDVTGFPGLVLWFHFPLLLESLCSDTLQHNEKQIEFLLRSLSFWYKSPESFSAMKKPGRNRNRHMTEPWEEDGQKKKVWVSYLCPIVQREYTVSQFVLGYTVRWDVQKSCSFFPRLCLCVCVCFSEARFHFLTPLICLTPPETSSLATWTGTTTLTASLWGKCLIFSPLVSSSALLYLVLPSVSSLSRSWADT